MNNEERSHITSNDYIDLLVEHKGDMNEFLNFPPGTINLIDTRYGVLHIPADNLTPNAISKFGYTAIPVIYGLQGEITMTESNDSAFHYNPAETLSGLGVIIGIIDTGIDYLNPLFQYPDGSTRILSIWDQSVYSEDRYPPNTNYGTEFTRDEINAAIRSNDPYRIVPSVDTIGHGTMLAGIAGGSVLEDFSGIAPECEFVIVKLKEAKQNLKNFFYISEDALAFQENDIMMAAMYLISYASRVQRPISIGMGIGTSQGDHGGRGLLSTLLSFYGNQTGINVSIPAGNESNRGHHYQATIDPTVGYDVAELLVGSVEVGFTIELYAVPPSNLWIEIYAPTGEYLTRVSPSLGGQKTIQVFYQDSSIIIDNQLKEDYAVLEQLIIFRFNNPIPGTWKFVSYNISDLYSTYHMWLPINAFISPDTYFLKPNNYVTITSPGNSNRPITVTAYNPMDGQLYNYASRGNTVLDEAKPDITAPGVNIVVPTTDNQYITSTGTSISTSYVTGVACQILEWGIIKGNNTTLNGPQIKRLLTISADRDMNLDYPNPDWGYGVLNRDKIQQNLFNDEIGIMDCTNNSISKRSTNRY